MSNTRPKRQLPTSTITPRRSDRIRESPVADYSPYSPRSIKTSQTRSRSKSRVLRDSHPPFESIKEDEISTAKRRLEMNPRVRLDCQSDDEDQNDKDPLPALKKTNSIDVIGVFDKFREQLPNRVSGFATKAGLFHWPPRMPRKSEVKELLDAISLSSVLKWCCAILVFILLLFSVIRNENIILVTIGSVLTNLRLFIISVPDFFTSRSEVLPAGELDYDTIALKVLHNTRFIALVEDLSLQREKNLESRFHQAIQEQVDIIQQRTSQLDQRIMNDIREEIDLVKESLKIETEKASKESELNQVTGQRFDAISLELASLEAKLLDLDQAGSAGSSGAADDAQFSLINSQLQALRSRLSSLESQLPDVRSEIQTCCNNKPDIKAELESRLEQIFSNVSSHVLEAAAATYATREDLDSSRQDIKQQLDTLREDISRKVKAETDSMAARMDNLISRAKSVQHESEQVLAVSNNSESENVIQSDYVVKIVKEALDKYDADKTGLFDFALESAGGSIVSTRCTENYEGSSAVLSVMGVPIWWESNNPRTILQPGMAPGQCWAFRGSTGAVVVKLSSTIVVNAVSVEHISLLSTPDGQTSSAPRTMQLSGVEGDNLISLGNFTYEKTGDPVQTFHIQSNHKLDTVELNILSNHGHPEYTCLYRFRVHGTPVEDKIH